MRTGCFKCHNRKKNEEEGFMLLEVLVSFMIFIIGIGLLSTSLMFYQKAQVIQVKMREAAQLGELLLQDLPQVMRSFSDYEDTLGECYGLSIIAIPMQTLDGAFNVSNGSLKVMHLQDARVKQYKSDLDETVLAKWINNKTFSYRTVSQIFRNTLCSKELYFVYLALHAPYDTEKMYYQNIGMVRLAHAE